MVTHGPYNRQVRRLAAVTVLVLFAFLGAIDGVCCPDSCTHEQETSSAPGVPGTDEICVLCLGGLNTPAPDDVSPGALAVARIVRAATSNPPDVSADPLYHPPRV
jgi:hypothetical protein